MSHETITERNIAAAEDKRRETLKDMDCKKLTEIITQNSDMKRYYEFKGLLIGFIIENNFDIE